MSLTLFLNNFEHSKHSYYGVILSLVHLYPTMSLEFNAMYASSFTEHSDPPQFSTVPDDTSQTTTTVSPLPPITTTSFDVSLDDLCAMIYAAR